MKRRLTTLVALVAAVCTLAAPSAAMADSAAVAVNTKDDSTVFKLVFDIQRVMGGTVDSSNAAVAVASCTSCETVAIAIQTVLAMGSPTVVIPENLALAMNVDCNLCQTLADAYQYIYTTGGPVHFTAEGNRQIADIRQQLEALRNAGLPLDQLQARVVELNNQLQQVLLTQLVLAGPPASGTDTQGSASPSDTGTSTTPAGTGTSTTPTDTSTTPTDTGTSTTPTDTSTSTTPTDTSTTPTDTGTSTTPTDTSTSTSTTPGG